MRTSVRNLTKDLIGTWKLSSFELRESGGKVRHLGGAGLLIYDEHGYMSAQLMRLGRPKFKSGDQLRGTPEEIKSAFEKFVSYYGTYEVNIKKSTVVHHIKASLFPNWVATDQERFLKLSGNKLTLSTPPMKLRGKESVSVFTWERVR